MSNHNQIVRGSILFQAQQHITEAQDRTCMHSLFVTNSEVEQKSSVSQTVTVQNKKVLFFPLLGHFLLPLTIYCP